MITEMVSQALDKISKGSLTMGLDIGHRSIGWAVLKKAPEGQIPEILGCGTVIFRSEDCIS